MLARSFWVTCICRADDADLLLTKPPTPREVTFYIEPALTKGLVRSSGWQNQNSSVQRQPISTCQLTCPNATPFPRERKTIPGRAPYRMTLGSGMGRGEVETALPTETLLIAILPSSPSSPAG